MKVFLGNMLLPNMLPQATALAGSEASGEFIVSPPERDEWTD